MRSVALLGFGLYLRCRLVHRPAPGANLINRATAMTR